MKRVHYTDSYLMSPQHPVTVNLSEREEPGRRYSPAWHVLTQL